MKENITLPSETSAGVPVIWSSSAPEVVDVKGKVTRPSDVSVKSVIMTAQWSRGGKTVTTDFAINVIGEDNLYVDNKYFTVNSNRVWKIKNSDTVSFVAEVTNTSDEIKNVIAVAAIYDEYGKLSGIAYDNNEPRCVNTGKKTLTATLTVPEKGSYVMKGFIFNCMNVLKPYSVEATIEM